MHVKGEFRTKPEILGVTRPGHHTSTLLSHSASFLSSTPRPGPGDTIRLRVNGTCATKSIPLRIFVC